TRDLLRLAQDSANRLEDTLLGILAFQDAVFGQGRAKNNTERKPISDVIANAAQSVDLGGRVTLSGPWRLASHVPLLEIVLTEVLENYAKFSEARTCGVSADLTDLSHRWELRFFARGPGLPPDVAAQLGRPYAQLESSFSGEVPGMGLGLATV